MAVIGLHAAAWFWGTSRLASEWRAEVDALRQTGWSIEAGEPRRAGWPFAVGLRIPALSVDGLGAGVPLSWAVGQLALDIEALHPMTLLATPAGTARIRIGTAPEFTLAGQLRVALRQTGFDLDGTGLDTVLPGGTVRVGTIHAEGASLSLQAVAAAIALPSSGNPLVLDKVTLRASMSRPLPAGSSQQQQWQAWRDAGGSMALDDLAIQSGRMSIAGSGTGHFDPGLQPALDGTLQVAGYREGLDAAVQAGLLPASAGVAAKAVLGLLSGTGGIATVPVRVQAGVLTLASFPLARLPALVWPP